MQNWMVVSNNFYFCPYLGGWYNLTNTFQIGRNHQLEKLGNLKIPIMSCPWRKIGAIQRGSDQRSFLLGKNAFCIVGRRKKSNGYLFSHHDLLKTNPSNWHTAQFAPEIWYDFFREVPDMPERKNLFPVKSEPLSFGLTGWGDDSGWCEDDLQFQVLRSNAALGRGFNGFWWLISFCFAVIPCRTVFQWYRAWGTLWIWNSSYFLKG